MPGRGTTGGCAWGEPTATAPFTGERTGCGSSTGPAGQWLLAECTDMLGQVLRT